MQLENGNLYCWQWDTKQRLIIEEIDENLNNYIYIGNPKDKVGLYKMEIYDESGTLYCDIPDEILQFAGTANIYLSEVSADKINTTAFWRFTIKEREKPMDYVFYPTEQITIQMIMEELKKTQDMVDPNTIQEEIHNYFVENPLSEQELDPVATKAIEKHNIDENAHNNILKNKVDKVVGKQLSTNDFSNDDKLKLDNSITYQKQELTEEQKEQARVNIGAMSQDVSIPSIEGLVTKAYVDEQLNNKVNKEDNKGLSTNDFTNIEKAKLAGIEEGAQVNIQSDHAQNNQAAPDYIKNRLAWTEYEVGAVVVEEQIARNIATEYLLTPIAPLKSGKKYLVKIDDIDYIIESHDVNISVDSTTLNVVYAGNASKISDIIPNGKDTDEPIAIVYDNFNNRNAIILVGRGEQTLKVSINEYIDTVHKLDPKYLPEDGFGYIENKEKVIFPETDITITEEIPRYMQIGNIGLQEGQSYIVNWNGTEYKTTCSHLEDGDFWVSYIGNAAGVGAGVDTGEPFIIADGYEDGEYFFMILGDIGNHTVSITELQETIHKIDEKFLPEATWDTISLKNVEVFNQRVSGFSEHGVVSNIPVSFELTEGQEYEVIWDGISYLVTPYKYKNILVIGNDVFSGTVSEEPFMIASIGGLYVIYAIDPSTSTSNTTVNTHSIIIKTGVATTIPKKYLPEDIVMSEDLTVENIGAASAKHSHVVSEIDGLQTEIDGKLELVPQMIYEDIVLPSRAYWNSVTYGNGKFVAISDLSIAYSEDGITWTEATMPINNYRSVTYGNGKFVAVAQNIKATAAAYSEDGITWTETIMPNSGDWNSVTYGNGKFVAVVYDSNIAAYSEDGITWTETIMPNSGYWNSVTYGNGKFVAVVYNSNIAVYSEDGITWTETIMPNSDRWICTTYGDDKFVAVAYISNIAAYSEDGITWTETIMPGAAYWNSVTYGDDKFVAVAYNSNIAAYSEDGITWTETIMPNSDRWECITYGDGKFVAVASKSNKIVYSEDGITWIDKKETGEYKYALYQNESDVTENTLSIVKPYLNLADVSNIQTAEVGQAIVVKAIDENGKPTEWETINSIKIDAQLSSSGQAADAKVVGEALAEKQPKGDYALKSDIIKELPMVSTSDNGKFLRVVAGQWAAQTIPNAEEVSF